MAPSVPDPHIVTVDLGDRAYDVHVGAGVRARLGSVMPAGARRAAVITQDGVGWTVDSGLDQTVLTVPDGLEDGVAWAEQIRWSGAAAAENSETVPLTEVVEGLRAVKDPAELARMQAAARIADEALAE